MIFDILYKLKRKTRDNQSTAKSIFDFPVCCIARYDGGDGEEKVTKGVRGMPWLLRAMKDVISCDKPWVGANNL